MCSWPLDDDDDDDDDANCPKAKRPKHPYSFLMLHSLMRIPDVPTESPR